MGHPRSRVLVGAVLVALTGVVGAVADGSGRSALALDLSSDGAPPGRLPASFRVVMSNRSDHEVAWDNLCLSVYAGGEFYAWARVSAPGMSEVAGGTSSVRVLPMSALEFDGPAGQRREPAAVARRLSRSQWSVVASVADESAQGRTGYVVTVWSNDLQFGPLPVAEGKP
jgi:hypothetical protein